MALVNLLTGKERTAGCENRQSMSLPAGTAAFASVVLVFPGSRKMQVFLFGLVRDSRNMFVNLFKRG